MEAIKEAPQSALFDQEFGVFHDSGRLAGGDRVQSHRTFIAGGKRLIYCKLFTQLGHYLWTCRINTGTHSHS